MRLLRITVSYDHYWQHFYREHPQLAQRPYAEQLQAYLGDFFMMSDAYSHNLQPFGYECQEFFYGIVPMQQAWAREHDLAWNRATYKYQHALAVVKHFQPDIVFLTSSEHDAHWIAAARAASPRTKLFVRWCAVSVPLDTLTPYDLVLTSCRGIEDVFRQYGLPVRRLPFGFDSRILAKMESAPKKTIPLSFIGSFNLANNFHLQRSKAICRLLEEDLVTLYAYVNRPSKKRQFAMSVARAAGKIARTLHLPAEVVARFPLMDASASYDDKLALMDKICAQSHGPRYGLDMYNTLAQSQATFNVHVDAAGEYVGNIRMYEATGAGACMLTDWKKDLAEFFEIDHEVVAYRDADEAIEKARWLRDHPDACREIGLAAQRRVLREHTYRERCAQLHAFLQEALITRSAV